MFKNLELIKPGDIIFTTEPCGLISWIIRKVLRFKYSHVALYIGMGNLIEADWGGIVINPISKYFDTSDYIAEIVDTKLTHEQINKLLPFAQGKQKEDYDYSLIGGLLFSRIIRRSRQMKALFNTTTSWTCSEFVASCLQEVGVKFKLPTSQITPKDLWGHFKES